MTIQEAVSILISNESYDWLTQSGQQMYSAAEVGKHMNIDTKTVTGWSEQGFIQNAQNFGGRMGWRMPRSSLLFYFAGLPQTEAHTG